MDRNSFYFHVYQALAHGKPLGHALSVQITDDGSYFWAGWQPNDADDHSPFLVPGVLLDRASRHWFVGAMMAPERLYRRPFSVDVVVLLQRDFRRYAFTRFGLGDWLSQQALARADDYFSSKSDQRLSLLYSYRTKQFTLLERYDLELERVLDWNEALLDDAGLLRAEVYDAEPVHWSWRVIYRRFGLLGLRWQAKHGEWIDRIVSLEREARQWLRVPFFTPLGYRAVRAYVLSVLASKTEGNGVKEGGFLACK